MNADFQLGSSILSVNLHVRVRFRPEMNLPITVDLPPVSWAGCFWRTPV